MRGHHELGSAQNRRFEALVATADSRRRRYVLVITAHDDTQARRYAADVGHMCRRGTLGPVAALAVVADRVATPPTAPVSRAGDAGEPAAPHVRPGPGGATCHALECVESWFCATGASADVDAAAEPWVPGPVPTTLFLADGRTEEQVGDDDGAVCAGPGAMPRLPYRVLMVHGGGYSSRLPNHSVSGKLLAPFPRGGRDLDSEPCPARRVLSLLEAKAASLVGLLTSPDLAAEGIFVAASDDVILAPPGALDGHSGDAAATAEGRGAIAAAIPRTGFTALAHPSALPVAESHGVFVLGDDGVGAGLGDPGRPQPAAVVRAAGFPHKRSAADLRAAGAVVDGGGGGGRRGDPWAWTDSAFFVSRATAASLLAVYRATDRFRGVEVDCYSDFLQCAAGLPERTAVDERESARRESPAATAGGNSRASVRRALRAALRAASAPQPLWVLPLPGSEFHHLGTMPEYVDKLSGREAAAFLSACAGTRRVAAHVDPAAEVADDACVLACDVAAGATVAAPCVLEFCTVGRGWQVSEGCILSGVRLPAGAGGGEDDASARIEAVVPPNTFMHTVSLADGTEVTHVLSTRDDVKGSSTLLGVPFAEALERIMGGEAAASEALAAGHVWRDGEPRDLFHARLFPAIPSAADPRFPDGSATLSLRLAFASCAEGVHDPGSSAASKISALRRVSIAECIDEAAETDAASAP